MIFVWHSWLNKDKYSSITALRTLAFRFTAKINQLAHLAEAFCLIIKVHERGERMPKHLCIVWRDYLDFETAIHGKQGFDCHA